MKTLRDVLNLKNEIEELAEQFHFMRGIKLYRQPGALTFIVQNNPEKKNSYKALQHLEVKLIELLGCKVFLIDQDAIKTLYQSMYADNSALLKADSLKALFGTEQLESVFFEDREEPDSLFRIVLEHANQFLMEKAIIAKTKPANAYSLFHTEKRDFPASEGIGKPVQRREQQASGLAALVNAYGDGVSSDEEFDTLKK